MPSKNLRIHIKWLVFRDLPAEGDIKTLTYDINPSVSEEEAKQKETNIEEHDEAEEE